MASDQHQHKLATQPEKPNHYTYLKEFRVEQCPSFLQHKCNQHRPFVCFNWHFMNQRRRRPVRKRDGTFNYSADNYCTKYDETTGICPDGDDCQFLHRTAGDTERRYHLRYYKTCMCVHDTDARGYCVKNGHHCAFAHGAQDQRPPMFDIKELEALQNAENGGDGGLNGPNALDKERNLMNEDPKWQDTNYVLANYKTEPCKRPPRLCRQGYACPQYHNSKDKRRSPRKYKYRSTPCPNVKHGEEWGEPANCEAGDGCQYCHTRTEQQFHPEIYKSTKCNDVQQAGYCPRSVFCAFAHVEPYMVSEEMQQAGGVGLESGTSNLALSDIISNAMAHENSNNNISSSKKNDKSDLNNYFQCSLQQQNGNGESSESASTSSLGSTNSGHNKAPGAQLQHKNNNINNAFTPSNGSGVVVANNNNQSNTSSSTLSQFVDYDKQLLAMENESMLGPLEKEQRKRMWLIGSLPNNMDGREIMLSHMENSISAGMMQQQAHQQQQQQNSHTAPVNIPGSPMNSAMAGLFQGTSAPVNIPNSSLSNFSPTTNHLFGDPFQQHAVGPQQQQQHHGHGSVPKMGNGPTGFAPGDNNLFFQSQLMSPNIADPLSSISPDLRLSAMEHLKTLRDELHNGGDSLFDNGMGYSKSPCINPGGGGGVLSELERLKEELMNKSAQLLQMEEQRNKVYEKWKSDVEDNLRKTALMEQQRDEALNHAQVMKEKIDLYSSVQNGPNLINGQELRSLSLSKLKSLQTKLRAELEDVEQVLYLQTATKCMKCEEKNRSVTLVPCNCFVLCDVCATNVHECPYCQTPISS